MKIPHEPLEGGLQAGEYLAQVLAINGRDVSADKLTSHAIGYLTAAGAAQGLTEIHLTQDGDTATVITKDAAGKVRKFIARLTVRVRAELAEVPA